MRSSFGFNTVKLQIGRMPFDVAVFFNLIAILTSLPAEQFSYPWHGDPPFPIPPGSYGPIATYRSVSPAAQRNYTRPRGEVFVPNVRTGQRYPQEGYLDRSLETRDSLEFSVSGQYLIRRSSDPYLVEKELLGSESYDKLEVQSTRNVYSSHVNCANQNCNKGTVQDNEPRYVGNEGKINFDETRNYGSGSAKGVNGPDARIINTNEGPKMTPGSSAKRPYQRVTNTIPTTEKMFRNQTRTKQGTRPQGGGIVFPGAYRNRNFNPDMSKCKSKGLTFCEELGDDYPKEHINQILKKEGAMLKKFFGADKISEPNITERFNAPGEESLCPSRKEVAFPKAAQNVDDKWMFIVNQDQYIQGVTVEICAKADQQCILSTSFPLGYVSYCKQKYIERRLIALSEDGKPAQDTFLFPSCCSCMVRFSPPTRMGLDRSGVTSAPKPRAKS